MKRFLAALCFLLWAPLALASSTEQWVGGNGVGLTWTNICGGEVQTTAVASGNAVQCSVIVANGTALDIFGDFSVNLSSVTTPAGALWIGIYIYPLNEDGTTYGDNLFGSAAAGPPDASYLGCSIKVTPSVTAVIVGMCRAVVLPPGSFKIVFYNGSGTPTNSTGTNTVQYRTYNRQQH
jgi:hypothetical protein